MDVIAILQSTERALDATAPLLIRALLLLVSLKFLLGDTLFLRPLRALVDRFGSGEGLADHPLVKESGFKPVPTSLLLGTLLLLAILDRVWITIGDQLPGRISLLQPELLVSSFKANVEPLVQLWALHPGAKDLGELQQVVDYRVAVMAPLANPHVAMPWLRHANDHAAAVKTFEVAKCFILIWLVVCLYRRKLRLPARKTWLRFALLVLAAIVVGAAAAGAQVRERREAERAKVAFLLAARLAADEKASQVLADSARLDDCRKKVMAFKAATKRKPYVLRW